MAQNTDETFLADQIHTLKCLVIRADVTQEKDVQAAIEATVARFGRIDYAA